MERETGDPKFPIWLIGDSNPKNWEQDLASPLDTRHPARHNIWTPIIDVIQDGVYRAARLRVETRTLYIRNAIESPFAKPRGTQSNWPEVVGDDVTLLSALIHQHKPVLVLTFGAFAFEFARRSQSANSQYAYKHWGAKSMGVEFRQRVNSFNVSQVNIFPLLHATIARGRFMQSHEYFAQGNYFDFVGEKLARILLENHDKLSIWIPQSV